MSKLNLNLGLAIYGLVLGFILFVLTASIHKESIKCQELDISNAISALFVISTSMVVSALAFFVCRLKTPKCSAVVPNTPSSVKVYIVFNTILAVLLITLGAIITNKTKNNDCSEKMKKSANGVWSLGVILLLPLIIYFVILFYRTRGTTAQFYKFISNFESEKGSIMNDGGQNEY